MNIIQGDGDIGLKMATLPGSMPTSDDSLISEWVNQCNGLNAQKSSKKINALIKAIVKEL